MRQIGTIADEAGARRLADYLLTLGITTRLDRAGDGWAVWVHREERVDQARRELEQFAGNPSDPRYRGVDQAARDLRKKARREQRQHLRNSIRLGGGSGFRPPERCRLTFGLMALSVAAYLASTFGADRLAVWRLLAIDGIEAARPAIGRVPPPVAEDDRPGTGARRVPRFDRIRRGEVWRLLTPIFLHTGLLSMAINLYWLYDLGGLVEMRRGTARLALLVLTTALASNLGQYYASGMPFFGGMAGVVFGLFGYIWVASRGDYPGGLSLRPNTPAIMLIWFLFYAVGGGGPLGAIRPAIGLVVGGSIGIASQAIRDRRS